MTIHVYNPANFDPAEALPADLAGYADCARYLVHRIIGAAVQRNVTIQGYAPLKFDYLRRVIPDRVLCRIKSALIVAGVIECDNVYVEGSKAYGYRLCSPYSEARVVRTLINSFKIADRLRRNHKVEHRKIKLDVHKYLRSQFSRLEIELPRAMDSLETHPHREILKISAEQIAAKDMSCTVCRYGRFHSELTRCHMPTVPDTTVRGPCRSLLSRRPVLCMGFA